MEIGQNNFSGILATKMEYIKSKNNISYNSAFNHLILEIISNDLRDKEIFLTEYDILDNSGDGGLDIGFIDDSSNMIYLIQNKNYSMISPQQIEEALNKLIVYLEKVKSGNFYEYNEKVKNFSNRLKLLINNDSELTFKIILNISTKINEFSWEKINKKRNEIEKRIFSILFENEKIVISPIEINGETELMEKISMMDDDEGIKDEVKLHIKKTGKTNSESTLIISDEKNQTKTFLTVIDAVKFRDFFSNLKYKGKLGSLYSKNVREYFKNNTVDKSIETTLRTKPEDFFILNNGLTIIGKNISVDGNTINITDMCIINGAQTTHLIGEAKISDEQLSKVSVFAKIIDISTFNIRKDFNEDEFINQISYASNNQKPVKKEDLITQNKVIINFVKIFNEMSKNTTENYSIQIKRSETIKKFLKNKKQETLMLSSIIKDSLKLLLLMPGTAKSGYSSFLNTDSIDTATENSRSTVLWIFKFLNPLKDVNKFKYFCEFIKIKKVIEKICKNKILDLTNEMENSKELGLEVSPRLLLLNEFYNTGQSFLESLFIYSKIVLNDNNLKKIVNKNINDLKNEYANNTFNEIFQKRINLNILNDYDEVKDKLSSIANACIEIFKDKLPSNKTITNAVKEDKIFRECALAFADQYLTDINNIYGKDLKIKNFFNKLFNI